MEMDVTSQIARIDVAWITKSNGRCLNIKINGHLSEKNALEATTKWKNAIATSLKEGEKANVICNCRAMTGYDSEARKMWQKTISDLKGNIDVLWIITDNTLFKTAARTMGLLTKFKIRIADSEEEVCSAQ